jgi:cytochrome P450
VNSLPDDLLAPAVAPLANDPAFMADPYRAYARWRANGRVHRTATPDGLPVWVVTRYPDVRAALSDPRLSLSKSHAKPGGYRGFSLPPALDANLLNLDPPDHTRLRRLVSKAFTPARTQALRPAVERHAGALLDAIADSGRADLIEEFAVPLPLTVIGELLGVPAEPRADFRRWTSVLIAPDPGEPSRGKEALSGIVRLLAGLIAAKRATPGDDLLSAMIAARDADDVLSEDELLSLAFLILWAGYENSVHLIGNGILAVLSSPGPATELLAAGSLPGPALEELIRFADPNQYALRRFATEDLTIGGVRIPAGDTVLLATASANHDPDRFTRPDTLDLARADNPQLSFGLGIHYCLGAPLARLETEVAITALFRRLPGLILDAKRDELRWRPSFRSRGLRELPVTWPIPSDISPDRGNVR